MKLLIIIISVITFAANAEDYQSAEHTVSLVELYTSEGCNSCPPAENWLKEKFQKSPNIKHIVALAFHVTYWDYLGWKDKFSSTLYDDRQRSLVSRQGGRSVYTPQLFLNGKTLGRLYSASRALNELKKSPAKLRIKASVSTIEDKLDISLRLKRLDKSLKDNVQVTVAAYENDIDSFIKAGENKGRKTQHQFVVRKLVSTLMSLKAGEKNHFSFEKRIAQQWSGLVVFVESGDKVIQVLDIALKKRT